MQDPLHAITLKKIVSDLVNHYGWAYLAQETKMNCFVYDPSINSSLKFFRKNPELRKKIEQFYVKYLREKGLI
jgi:uncharacterized protein (DUF2132 family)